MFRHASSSLDSLQRPCALPSVPLEVVLQKAIATTGTAIQLSTGALVNGVTITANINNAAPMTVGPTGVNNTQTGSGNGYILQPGASMSFSISNLSPIYLNGTAGDFVSYTGN